MRVPRVPQSPTVLLVLGGVILGAAMAVAAIEAQQPPEGEQARTGRGPGGLSGFALFTALDRDGQPGLSPAEIDGAADVLRALDRNGDGRLAADELPMPARGRRGEGFGRGEGGRGRGEDEGPGGAGGAGTSADDLAATLMGFDQNHDGTLTRSEVPERFQGLFDRVDADKNGVLTADELKQGAAAEVAAGAAGARGREGRGEREGRAGFGRGFGPDPLVAALDTDRDGALSVEELSKISAVLRGFDRNGDGTVALTEVFAGFGRGRG
jgi:Ca2+-binding EF-hand superfamily protein